MVVAASTAAARTMRIPPPPEVEGMMWLASAMLIFSSQSSVYVLLNKFRGDIFNACNILCASSTYASIMMIGYFVFYKSTLSWNEVKALSQTQWIALTCGSILYSVVGPFFYLTALTTVEVPIATILQRLETLYFLVLTYCFAGEHFTYWNIFNVFLTCIGVLTAVIWYQTFPIGYFYVIISGAAYSGSLLISKKYLTSIHVGVVAVFRVVIGAFLFHMLNLGLNKGKIGQLSNGTLWLYCLPFGFIYIFLGQITWLISLDRNSPVVINIGTNVLFILALIFAAIVIQQYPNKSEWVSSVIILISIISSMWEIVRKIKYEGEEKEEEGEEKQCASNIITEEAGQHGAVMNVMLASARDREDSLIFKKL